MLSHIDDHLGYDIAQFGPLVPATLVPEHSDSVHLQNVGTHLPVAEIAQLV